MAALMLAASAGVVDRLHWLGIDPRVAVPAACAAFVLGLAALLLTTRSLRAPLERPSGRALAWTGFALVGCALASTAVARDRWTAFGFALELAASLAVLFVAANAARPHLERAMAAAALVSVAANAALCLAGLPLSGLLASSGWPYQVDSHQHLAGLPRFYGLGVTPFGLGVTMYACMGLLEGWPSARGRALGRAAAVVMTLASLSFATLLLPVLVIARIHRAWLRRTALALSLVAALGVLYVHPLELRVGGHTLTLGTLHPRYGSHGRGPTYMPVRELRCGAVVLTFHGTGYWYLMRNALACSAGHRLLGVGGGNAQQACKTLIMNTYGKWYLEGRPHNEYLGLLAELGLAGALAALGVAAALGRRGAIIAARPWPRASLAALLGCAFAGRVIATIPFVLLMATSMPEVDPRSPADE